MQRFLGISTGADLLIKRTGLLFVIGGSANEVSDSVIGSTYVTINNYNN